MNPLATLAPPILTVSMVVLAACALAMLMRSFTGPRMSDRIVGVNMIGTQSICLIVCLVLRLKEDWLVDIAIVYAMFSFLAVAVLTKMDIGVYRQWRLDQQKSHQRHLESRSAYRKAHAERHHRRDNS